MIILFYYMEYFFFFFQFFSLMEYHFEGTKLTFILFYYNLLIYLCNAGLIKKYELLYISSFISINWIWRVTFEELSFESIF